MRLKDKNVVRLGTNKPKIFGANRVKFRRKIACAEFRRVGVSEASSEVHGFFSSLALGAPTLQRSHPPVTYQSTIPPPLTYYSIALQ